MRGIWRQVRIIDGATLWRKKDDGTFVSVQKRKDDEREMGGIS